MTTCFSFWETSSRRPPTGAPPLNPAGGLPSPGPLVQFWNFLKKSPGELAERKAKSKSEVARIVS